MRAAQRIGNIIRRAKLNYEKLYDVLVVRLAKERDMAELATLEPDPRHVARDKRTRKSPVGSSILAFV